MSSRRRSTVLHFSFPSGDARPPDYASLTPDVRLGGLLRVPAFNYTRVKGSARKEVVTLGPRLSRRSRERRVDGPEPLVEKCFPRGSFEYQ